jgi:hypothetical protein
MPSYGLLTNPSNEISDEITNIHDLDFEYVEVEIEGPEGNPLIIEEKNASRVAILPQLTQNFDFLPTSTYALNNERETLIII